MKAMKVNRFVALAAIAVLVVGAIAVFKGGDIVEAAAPFASRYLGIQGLGENESEANEADEAAESDAGAEVNDNESDADAADINASIKVDAATLAGKTEAEQAAILTGLAKISEAQANAAALAANTGTTVSKATLEVDNGGLVYEVSLSNGVEVYVDAGTGTVIKSATDQD